MYDVHRFDARKILRRMGIYLKKFTTFYYMTLGSLRKKKDGGRIKICETFSSNGLKEDLSIDTTFDPCYFLWESPFKPTACCLLHRPYSHFLIIHTTTYNVIIFSFFSNQFNLKYTGYAWHLSNSYYLIIIILFYIKICLADENSERLRDLFTSKIEDLGLLTLSIRRQLLDQISSIPSEWCASKNTSSVRINFNFSKILNIGKDICTPRFWSCGVEFTHISQRAGIL